MVRRKKTRRLIDLIRLAVEVVILVGTAQDRRVTVLERTCVWLVVHAWCPMWKEKANFSVFQCGIGAYRYLLMLTLRLRGKKIQACRAEP